MKFSQVSYGVELANGQVFLFDPNDATQKIPVDQIVFDAVNIKGTKAIGLIVSIHGLDNDIARYLPAQMLRDLGVGTHMTPGFRIKSGMTRYRAAAGADQFERVNNR